MDPRHHTAATRLPEKDPAPFSGSPEKAARPLFYGGECATMCYMPDSQSVRPVRPLRPDRVGVRELRQNLSVYLARVIAGERLEVTDRGNPVAVLIPIHPGATLVERLVAEGRAIPARTRYEDQPPVDVDLPADFGERVQQALRELRDDPR